MIFKFVHLFKLVQVVAFSLWYLPRFGLDLPPTLPDLPSMALAAYLLVFGQVLNACVWHQIGIEGVCYGVKFGRKIPWCTQFPYSVMNDPQYFGAIMTVWGLFLLTSGAVASPVEWITIPVIETILYAVSMKVEY